MAKIKSRLDILNEKKAQLAEEERNLKNAIAFEKDLNELLKKHAFASYEAFVSFMYPGEGKPSAERKSRAPGTRLSEEDREKIVSQLKDKKSVSYIAEAHGVSIATINKIKKDANLVTPRKKS